jgi:hypothetical protein
VTGLLAWARAFAFTQLVEVPIYRRGLGASWARAFGASAITHPIVWWVAVESGWSASWAVRAASVEGFALVVEAIWFGVTWGARRGLLWSLVANTTSFTLGLLSYRWFGA